MIILLPTGHRCCIEQNPPEGLYWVCRRAGHWDTHLIQVTSNPDTPLEKLFLADEERRLRAVKLQGPEAMCCFSEWVPHCLGNAQFPVSPELAPTGGSPWILITPSFWIAGIGRVHCSTPRTWHRDGNLMAAGQVFVEGTGAR